MNNWKRYSKKQTSSGFAESLNSIKWSNPFLSISEEEVSQNVKEATENIRAKYYTCYKNKR